MARLAQGRADDLLTSVVLSSSAPVVVIPAMHPEMWLNSATVENVQTLRERGYFVMEPAEGRLTGSDVGIGRFPETQEILTFIEQSYGFSADLIGKKFIITGGGTREPIDPVRYIGNRSSGKQARYIAEQAAMRGAEVTLILGPNQLDPIEGIETINIETALEMDAALDECARDYDVLIMTAAVADARPVMHSGKKIKKADLGAILLEENPDLLEKIISRRQPGQIVVGFAAETEPVADELIRLGSEKLQRKRVDLLFVNDVSSSAVFGAASTNGHLLRQDGVIQSFTEISKEDLAHHLLETVKGRLS
jgi:phosphopantothenoylcysteine decarboxylase/phosphopantothenate--cysteine ligase